MTKKARRLWVYATLSKKSKSFGVSEPSVQTANFDGKNRIIVELPGIKDTKEAINLIGKTAQLTFYEETMLPAKRKRRNPIYNLDPNRLNGS